MASREIVFNVQASTNLRVKTWLKIDGRFYGESTHAAPRLCAWLDEQGIPHRDTPLRSTIERDGDEWVTRIMAQNENGNHYVDPNDRDTLAMVDIRRPIASEPPAELEVSEALCHGA